MDQFEKDLLAGVTTDAGWDLVETFSRKPRETPEQVQWGGAEIASRLEHLGLKPRLLDANIYLGLPRWAKMCCEGVNYHVKAMAFAPEVPHLEAELVYLPGNPAALRVHTRDPAVLFGATEAVADLRKRVAGKIVVTEGLSNPGRSELLQQWGALAIVAINPGERVHWGTSSTIWGSPQEVDVASLPSIASLAISRSDGQALIAAAGRGGRASIAVESLSGWFRQPIPVVEIEGREHPQEFVLVHGHYDSWSVGVGDNATGNAVLLETAHALHKVRDRLKRSIRVAWWPGHSAGRYAGSTWYADHHAHDLRRNCVANLNCDSPGCSGATDYSSIRGMLEAEPLVQMTVRELFNQACRLERPGRAGDYSFNNLGLSGAMLTSSMVPLDERKRQGWYAVGGNGGRPVWHTEFDTHEIADRSIVGNDVRLYGLLAIRIAQAPVTPMDYRLPVADLLKRLRKDRELAAGVVDLVPHEQLLEQLERQIGALYSAETRAKAGDAGVHRRLMAVSRRLVRLDYCVEGPYQQDPAVVLPQLPRLEAARHEEIRTDPALQLSLLRSANEVREELELAIEELMA